jgi:hypothetical protein
MSADGHRAEFANETPNRYIRHSCQLV